MHAGQSHTGPDKKYDIIDFDLGIKITGAGSPCIRKGASYREP